MKKGYASNYIINGDKTYINSLIIVENGIFINILPLNKEYPVTKFYDGALILTPVGATIQSNDKEITEGEKIDIWQIFNYADCRDNKELYKTRKVTD